MLVYLFFCAWACCDCYLLLYLFFAICVSDSFGDVTVFFAISGIVVLFKVVEKIIWALSGGGANLAQAQTYRLHGIAAIALRRDSQNPDKQDQAENQNKLYSKLLEPRLK